jgi:hypothetical protein
LIDDPSRAKSENQIDFLYKRSCFLYSWSCDAMLFLFNLSSFSFTYLIGIMSVWELQMTLDVPIYGRIAILELFHSPVSVSHMISHKMTHGFQSWW